MPAHFAPEQADYSNSGALNAALREETVLAQEREELNAALREEEQLEQERAEQNAALREETVLAQEREELGAVLREEALLEEQREELSAAQWPGEEARTSDPPPAAVVPMPRGVRGLGAGGADDDSKDAVGGREENPESAARADSKSKSTSKQSEAATSRKNSHFMSPRTMVTSQAGVSMRSRAISRSRDMNKFSNHREEENYLRSFAKTLDTEIKELSREFEKGDCRIQNLGQTGYQTASFCGAAALSECCP